MTDYRPIIEAAWEDKSLLEQAETQDAIRAVINQIDAGELRCAAPSEEGWIINEWVKKAVVLYFPIQKMETLEAGIFEYHDKMPLKRGYKEKGIRVVPNAVARHGAYIAPGTILMPSYVNIGAYVDSGTMVDTWPSHWRPTSMQVVFGSIQARRCESQEEDIASNRPITLVLQ